MIVILNNGSRINIPKDAVQSILQTLLSGEVKQWQCQIDASNKEITSILNLKEVSAICHEEDIVENTDQLIAHLDKFNGALPNKDESGKLWCQKFRQYLVELIK